MANRQTHTPAKKPDAKQAKPEKQPLLDETVWESFPLSDPWADSSPDERKKN
jgi:hypothetical protein